MNLIYTTLFFLALPVILLRLVLRGFHASAYWRRWPERFGYLHPATDERPLIWIHAVSVGEVEACRPLVKALQIRFPGYQLHITTMTPTGSERVKSLFSDTVTHSYLPYDLPFAIAQFAHRIHPRFGIIMETEIWPNLIDYFYQHAIPLFLVNARMSERSAKGYARFRPFIRSVLEKFALIAVQGVNDKQRFQELGADSQKLHITGNLKYESTPPVGITEQAAVMRDMWGQHRQVFIAASTHEGEEQIIINAFRSIRAQFPNLLLVLVPRHPERFDHVAALAQKSGFKTLRRSEHRPCPSDVNILLIDTMGELPLFYAASDIAFIGGSLVPHGGHNLLEPAALSKAIMIGPHYFNFSEIVQTFLSAHAIIEIKDLNALIHTSIDLLGNEHQRQQMGQICRQLLAQNQGASDRLLNLIHFYLSHHEE